MTTKVNLKQMRHKAGITMTTMASLLGVSYMTIYRWEKGITPIKNIYLREYVRVTSDKKNE